MIAAVVLAAGSSQRLGRPKQLVVHAGVTLVARACMLAQEAGCDPVIVVTGAFAEAIESAIADQPVTIVRNPHHTRGMGSSIAIGVHAAAMADGVVIMTVDQPFITSEHLRALAAEPGQVAATAYADTVGIPAYFPKQAYAALELLDGDRGAKPLLASARRVVCEKASRDVDTLAHLELLAGATRA